MQKTISTLLSITIIILNACSSNYMIKKGDLSLSELNNELEGKKTSILLTDGQEFKAENIVITTDSTFFTESDSQIDRIVLTSNVNKIVNKDYGKGRLEGLGFGLLGVFAMGSIFNYEDTGGTFIGNASLLLGLLAGAEGGHTNRYILNEPVIIQYRYIKTDVISIEEDNGKFKIITSRGKQITLLQSQIKHIDRSSDKIFITITKDIYNHNFE